ncbi:MAG: HpcH/HpaI aldolase/citrate lyase family protein [Rhizobium sp.]|nr:HpcH/HpaI aldolase/citrate lyase family protein [Rhizobium sp.]MCZ8350858.1 HpcH/HpaI aldolase/citrate lyase family protein [Rhizobium sp.]
MPAPVNLFKKALREDQGLLTGLWVALANPHSAEICAGAGFDWILIDAEHGPNDIPLIAAQLAAVTRHPAHPVVRLPVGEPWMIKQALDIGAQTLMIPMVETGEQAALLAKALRYPPDGIRGMGASLGRASNFGRIPDYADTANMQVCLIAQIESRLGVENADAILAVEGVDAVLIGPADLSADMGYRGKATVPEVMQTVEALIGKIKASGKPAGIMTGDAEMIALARRAGVRFMATGTDTGLLARAAAALAAEMRGADRSDAPAAGGYS